MIECYLYFLLAFQPFEEWYHCNHPNTISELPHFACNWKEDDFIKNGDMVFLKKEKSDDNKIKKYFRDKYWEKRR